MSSDHNMMISVPLDCCFEEAHIKNKQRKKIKNRKKENKLSHFKSEPSISTR